MRLVGPDERQPPGAEALDVIIEDLTAAKNTVVECIGVAGEDPVTVEKAEVAASLSQLLVHIELVIGMAQEVRAKL